MNLPPLTALRAAEAAARTGSIAAAAAELGVSAPAVSQQLKLLEEHLGRKLFDRGRMGVTPTDAGRAVLPHLTDGFEHLAKVAEIGTDVRAPGRLVISAAASVAIKWLPAALSEARAALPGLRVELRMEEDPVDFGDRGPDLRIGYGDLPYSGLVREPLVQDFLLPMCAPDQAAPFDDDRYIHTDWGGSYATPPVWKDWAALAGRDAPDPRRGQRAGASALALDMAARGMGLALCQALLGKRDLDAGRVVIPFGPAIPFREPYTICYRDRGARPGVAPLVAYLKEAAARDVAAIRAISPPSA